MRLYHNIKSQYISKKNNNKCIMDSENDMGIKALVVTLTNKIYQKMCYLEYRARSSKMTL